MLWLGLAVLVVLFCFSFVLLFGAPYLPTLTKHLNVALDMVDLAPGDTLLELGCGDGKVLLAAARRGWNVVGYELNPLLVLICQLRTWRYRRLVTVKWDNFWQADWPPAAGIFVFVMPRHMIRLDQKIAASSQGLVKIVSFAFAIPDKPVVRQQDGVYLYHYGANAKQLETTS